MITNLCKRVPGHLRVKLPPTPAPPSPRQLTGVSRRGLIPDVSAPAGDVKCGEEELVRQGHTLFVRSEQQVVVYELQVQEEVEGVRQEVRDVKREHDHVDGTKDSLL